MHPATLRIVCVKNIVGHLMSGVWDKCEENPFSRLPISVVQEIMSSMWHAESKLSRSHIYHSRLLLTSGRLESIVLPLVEHSEDFVRLLRMLLPGCQNLRTLSIRSWYDIEGQTDAGCVLQELLQSCMKLDFLHSSAYFDPKDLQTHKNLKTIRLHFDHSDIETFFHCITYDLLKRLQSIEELALCRHSMFPVEPDTFLIRKIGMLLDECPQLTSLGHLDSSGTLLELYDKDPSTLGSPRRFQLRRCYWNAGEFTAPSPYCDRIRVAALSCPLVEALVIKVHYAPCLLHLKVLKNLMFLKISFSGFDYDCRQEFYSLLGEIGPQLRHLSVEGHWCEPLSLNVIFENCPNLNVLQINCRMTADEGVQPCVNLLKLQCLSVCLCGRKSIFYLLSNPLHLKVLCLTSCNQLEDGALRLILRKNPLAELEVALINGCSLSLSGWTRFLQSTVKLSKCCIGPKSINLMSRDEMLQCVSNQNPNVVCHSKDDFAALHDEHFPLNNSCWL